MAGLFPFLLILCIAVILVRLLSRVKTQGKHLNSDASTIAVSEHTKPGLSPESEGGFWSGTHTIWGVALPLADPLNRGSLSSAQRAHLHRVLEQLRASRSDPTRCERAYGVSKQLSMAYTLAIAPEGWELYALGREFSLPRTRFYDEHGAEICETLRASATAALLDHYAEPRLQLEREVTERERRAYHSFAGTDGRIQYVDPERKCWNSVAGVDIRWADSREYYQRLLLMAECGELVSQRDKSMAWASHPDSIRAYLTKLNRTPDFKKDIFTLVRRAENDVRANRGVPSVGEGWVSETDLYYRVRSLLPGEIVQHHGKPVWLGRQHLDIWIPSRMAAIEYQGIQHFRAIDFFGGETAFEDRKRRDAGKRTLCEKHGVRLLEIAYDSPPSYDALQGFLGL